MAGATPPIDGAGDESFVCSNARKTSASLGSHHTRWTESVEPSAESSNLLLLFASGVFVAGKILWAQSQNLFDPFFPEMYSVGRPF
jgi:hypothetical protein